MVFSRIIPNLFTPGIVTPSRCATKCAPAGAQPSATSASAPNGLRDKPRPSLSEDTAEIRSVDPFARPRGFRAHNHDAVVPFSYFLRLTSVVPLVAEFVSRPESGNIRPTSLRMHSVCSLCVPECKRRTASLETCMFLVIRGHAKRIDPCCTNGYQLFSTL